MNKNFKKLIKSSLATCMMLSYLSADHSDKTFLMPRSQNVNLAMEYTTFNESIDKNHKYKNGCTIALNNFYQESFKSRSLGKYFGVKDKNSFHIGNTGNSDVLLKYIVNFFTLSDYDSTLTLKPKQKTYGVQLDLYQDLEEISKGLYFKANIPFVRVENSLNRSIKVLEFGQDPATKGLIADGLKAYFDGKYINNLEDFKIAQLNYAKITQSQDKAGLADFDMLLGYKFLNRKCCHLSLNVGMTVPTGNTVQGQYIFEPVLGNGHHFAFGGGLDFGAKLFGKNDWAIKFNLTGNYRYLVEATEKRTLSLNVEGFADEFDQITNHFSHYFLVGQEGTVAGTPLFPAANILTRNLSVTPRSQLDAIAGLTYVNGGFTFDLGYNLFYKDNERVHLRHDPFENKKYGIADGGYTTDEAFTILSDAVGAHKLVEADLNIQAAKTPSYFTQKIFGGLGYIYKDWKNPILLGVGSWYEFANNNAQLETWALWFKAGISF